MSDLRPGQTVLVEATVTCGYGDTDVFEVRVDSTEEHPAHINVTGDKIVQLSSDHGEGRIPTYFEVRENYVDAKVPHDSAVAGADEDDYDEFDRFMAANNADVISRAIPAEVTPDLAKIVHAASNDYSKRPVVRVKWTREEYVAAMLLHHIRTTALGSAPAVAKANPTPVVEQVPVVVDEFALSDTNGF